MIKVYKYRLYPTDKQRASLGAQLEGHRLLYNQALAQRKETVMSEFEKELEKLINKYSLENGSDTPDFILAEYLTLCLSACLSAFGKATKKRGEWYSQQGIVDKKEK